MRRGAGRKLSYQNQVSLAERSRTSCVPALLMEMSHPRGAGCPVHEVHLQRISSLNLIHYAPHFSSMPTHPGNSHPYSLQRTTCSLLGAAQIKKRKVTSRGERGEGSDTMSEAASCQASGRGSASQGLSRSKRQTHTGGTVSIAWRRHHQ